MAKPAKIPGLRPRVPFRAAARRIIAAKYAEMQSFVPGTKAGDEEALHDMRIASKRLREAICVTRGAFPQRRYRGARQAVNELNDALGLVRDSDVFLAWLDELAPDLSPQEAAAAARVRAAVDQERDSHVGAMEAAFVTLLEERVPRSLRRLVGRRRLDRSTGVG